jgi:dephospho-CoA kinase
MSVFTIAVTGSAGSGKSLVCECFAELGLTIFDCDKISREVVEPGMQAYNDILGLFGKKIVKGDNNLDRPALRKMIVGDTEMRKGLEKIMHPAILQSLFLKIKKADIAGLDMVAVEIPLLFELSVENEFDFIVSVVGEKNDLVDRIVNRDNVSKKDAANILSIQVSQKEKINRSDFVIWNTGGINELKESVYLLYKKIKKEYLT